MVKHSVLSPLSSPEERERESARARESSTHTQPFPFSIQAAPCLLVAVFAHPGTHHPLPFRVAWAACVYMEAVSVLPQLRAMQKAKVSEEKRERQREARTRNEMGRKKDTAKIALLTPSLTLSISLSTRVPGRGEVHGPLRRRPGPLPLHFLCPLAAPDHGWPVLLTAGDRVGAVADHGAAVRGCADLHPGGFLVRRGRERDTSGRGWLMDGWRNARSFPLLARAHARAHPLPSLSHSFYYLKSYVEGTGVVHLAAGIV